MSVVFKLNCLRLSCLSIKLQQIYCRKICTSKPLNFLSTRLRRIGLSADKERLQMLKDKVPKDYTLIYRAPMENYIFALRYTTGTSAVLITALACYKYVSEKDAKFHQLQASELVSQESDVYFFVAAFIGFFVATTILISKYPLRIYRNADKYVAIYSDSLVPYRFVNHNFQKGEVEAVRNILNPWRDSMYRLGKRPSLILLNYFKTPAEFHEMVGDDFKY